MKRCPLCSRECADLSCWAVEGEHAWLCPGCVARARAAGYRIVWIPRRMAHAADTFRLALVEQAAIVEEQGLQTVVRRVA